MDLAELSRKLSAHHQEKTLRFIDQLTEGGKQKLLGQLSALDLDSISKLTKEYVTQKPHIALPKDIRPVKVYPHKPTAELKDRKSTRLNSSHANISYAVFCLKKKKK